MPILTSFIASVLTLRFWRRVGIIVYIVCLLPAIMLSDFYQWCIERCTALRNQRSFRLALFFVFLTCLIVINFGGMMMISNIGMLNSEFFNLFGKSSSTSVFPPKLNVEFVVSFNVNLNLLTLVSNCLSAIMLSVLCSILFTFSLLLNIYFYPLACLSLLAVTSLCILYITDTV